MYSNHLIFAGILNLILIPTRHLIVLQFLSSHPRQTEITHAPQAVFFRKSIALQKRNYMGKGNYAMIILLLKEIRNLDKNWLIMHQCKHHASILEVWVKDAINIMFFLGKNAILQRRACNLLIIIMLWNILLCKIFFSLLVIAAIDQKVLWIFKYSVGN